MNDRNVNAEPWRDTLDRWLASETGPVTISAVFRALGVQPYMQTTAKEAAIKAHLTAREYRKFRTRIGGRQTTAYRKEDWWI